MKKAFALCLFLAVRFVAVADDWGKINFANLGIPKSDGSGTYNVPLQADSFSGPGAGTVPGGFFLGLFLPGSATPFVTGTLGTNVSTGRWVVAPAISQTVEVPGHRPGD